MPKYTATPAKDEAAGFFNPPDGIYEVKVTKVSSFERDNAKGDITHGVLASLKIAEGEFADKSVTGINFYYHSDGAKGFSKAQLMAILGYTKETEAAFNEFAEGLDWTYDPDTKGVGDAWSELKGKRFKAEFKMKLILGTERTRTEISNVFPL